MGAEIIIQNGATLT